MNDRTAAKKWIQDAVAALYQACFVLIEVDYAWSFASTKNLSSANHWQKFLYRLNLSRASSGAWPLVLEFQIARSANNRIAKDEFDLVLEKSNAKPLAGTNSFSSMYSDEIAWLLLRLDESTANSYLRLSLSLANPKLGLILEDTLKIAHKVATHLNAQLVECSSQQEISAENVVDLADESSPFFSNIIDRWDNCLTQMNDANAAPLELPIHGIDYVDEYFCLYVQSAFPCTLIDLEKKLGFNMKHRDAFHAAIFDGRTRRPMCKISIETEGRLRIQPFYWKNNFSHAAAETLQVAELVAAACSTDLYFFQTLMTEQFRAKLINACSRLGLAFRDLAAAGLD